MKIGDVEKITGLTSKNGRLCSSKRDIILGIDIGTTTISAVVIDIVNNEILETYTVANDSKLPTDSDLSEYDAEWIVNQAKNSIDFLIKIHPNVKSIGFTGQMHGVLYVDEFGNAVSPLFNWQDGRGNRKTEYGKTYCDEMKDLTGYTVFSGYGFASLFYNRRNYLEPQMAKSFCTVMDYVAMKVVGNTSPTIHPSNAAGLGLYNIKNNCFDSEAVKKLDLEHLHLPDIVQNDKVIGYYKKIPISVAIGDNQASFYGSVKEEKASALINFGTGSQISVIVDSFTNPDENLEVRPYLFDNYLLCGSALCGGKAYAILEKFFSGYVKEINKESGSQYEIMNVLAQKAYDSRQELKVSTTFCGTRKEPNLRGAISGIGEENFTPQNLVLGVLQGMVDELKIYFDCMKIENVTHLVASGNAVRKNKVLQMLLKDIFRAHVDVLDYHEEAAVGAALYAGICSRAISPVQVTKIITYKKG